MAGQDIASWFEEHHAELLRAYIELAEDRRRFPGFADLPPSARRKVMERELLGLASFLATDPDGLTEATDTHREQAETVHASIPLDEQIAFLDARVEMVRDYMLEHGDQLENRDDCIARVLDAGRYYKVNTRSIELGKRLGGLSSDDD